MKVWTVLLLMTCNLWAAVVPDGSVVHSEAEAPRLSSDQVHPKKKPPSSSSSSSGASALPSPASGSKSGQASSSPADSGSSTAGSNAFSDRAEEDPSLRPQMPLAPVAAPTSNTRPLWTAVLVFAVLAGGGIWLAQNRSVD